MAHLIFVWMQLQKNTNHTDKILVNVHTNKKLTQIVFIKDPTKKKIQISFQFLKVKGICIPIDNFIHIHKYIFNVKVTKGLNKYIDIFFLQEFLHSIHSF